MEGRNGEEPALFPQENSPEGAAWDVRFFVYWRYGGHQNGDKRGKLWYNVNKVQTFLDEEQNYETFARICDPFTDGGY